MPINGISKKLAFIWSTLLDFEHKVKFDQIRHSNLKYEILKIIIRMNLNIFVRAYGLPSPSFLVFHVCVCTCLCVCVFERERERVRERDRKRRSRRKWRGKIFIGLAYFPFFNLHWLHPGFYEFLFQLITWFINLFAKHLI